MNRNTNAGEEPLRPVTASIKCSGTSSAIPKQESRFMVRSHSAWVTLPSRQAAIAPSPTKAGVLGITRMMCAASLFSRPCSFSRLHPATMERISASGRTEGAIWHSTSAIYCGFTANSRQSAWATAVLSSVTCTPSSPAIFSSNAVFLSDTRISSGWHTPVFSHCRRIAPPMLPQPMIPIFSIFIRFLSPVIRLHYNGPASFMARRHPVFFLFRKNLGKESL